MCLDCLVSTPPVDCSSCNICNAGYFSDGLGGCTACTTVDTYCSSCTSSVCNGCTSPYNLDANGNCVCNATSLQFMGTGGACVACDIAISNCDTCTVDVTGATHCSLCKDGSFQTSLTVCTPCDPTKNCATCASTSITYCDTCLPTYTMMSLGVCGCNTTAQIVYYAATLGCAACAIVYPGCTNCDTTTQICTACSAPLYWNSSTLKCELCPSTCTACTSLSVCSGCAGNLQLSQTLSLTPPD